MNLYDVLAEQGATHFERLFSQKFAGGTVQTLTGIPPLSFRANGKPLVSWSMLGNGQQSGTPTPDNPVLPTFCGKLVGTDWTIPITCAGQTTPVYLGQTQTVRWIEKIILDGNESWTYFYNANHHTVYMTLPHKGMDSSSVSPYVVCTHYRAMYANINLICRVLGNGTQLRFTDDVRAVDVETWKSHLAQQYANGTPVVAWYVLAEPTTGIVNEPLAKIGDYADELHSADAGVSIPTAKGQNTLTVDTELQPSEMTITFKS